VFAVLVELVSMVAALVGAKGTVFEALAGLALVATLAFEFTVEFDDEEGVQPKPMHVKRRAQTITIDFIE
jgi:hypothetical protein